MATKRKTKRHFTRKLFSETLEPRAMMAADVSHNFVFPMDVDDDSNVTLLDALSVINRINGTDDSKNTERRFHDVNDDSLVTPLDALALINSINSQSSMPVANQPVIAQSSALRGESSGSRVRVELETVGAETELKIRIDNAPTSSSFPVRLDRFALGQLTTDARGRGQIVLSRGDDNREHLPLPAGLSTLSPEMELVIGDIVKGTLSQVAKVEDNGVGNTVPTVPTVPTPTTVSVSEHFVAVFSGTEGAGRSAEYEQETERGVVVRKFKAEVERAKPNSTLDVHVAGVSVGKITTDSKGKGKLLLTSRPKDARDQLIPATFPAVSDGTKVTIGAADSTFRKAPTVSK